MHLCFVAPRAWPVLSGDPAIPIVGGAEVQQSLLARLFAARGHRVSMICLDYGQPQRARVDGVEVVKFCRMKAGLPVLRFLHPRVTSMWRAMREIGADIYYCRSASMWVGVLAEFCRRYGRRSIYAGASNKDFVADVGGQLAYARDRWLYRRGIARVDGIVAQNEEQRASLRATHRRDAVVIPSCYRAPERKFAGKGDCVLWVGTLHRGKRPELLLELAKRLPQRRFVLVGGPSAGAPDLYERVRAQAATMPNVEMTGFLPLAEVEPLFDRARVFVNTSIYEGMPNTFLQAWARGVPTVATVDVEAPVHRVVADLEGLALQVESAFDDPDSGQACREYYERNHAPAHVLARYEALFASL
jgi:glycosyltransferase involved in cell wall biosynthesis